MFAQFPGHVGLGRAFTEALTAVEVGSEVAVAEAEPGLATQAFGGRP